MIARLRQLPLLALLFLAGSPGVGGVALQAVHACTADLAAAPASDAAHHGGHHDDTRDDERCHCIGACHAPFYTVAPRAGTVEHVALPPAQPLPVPQHATIPPAGRGHRLLPPATAPPLS
jgi:hypothetical protein